MANPENKDIDSFIWSTTYERYERNIKKDREDKRLGQWNLHEDKIKNLKYSYVYLKDSGNLIVKKYKIEKFEKSGFDKDFNDPEKWCFIFSESEDFFVDHPTVVQGRQYGSSLEIDNFKKPSKEEVDQKKIDLILDKISKSGYDSLTKSEKETLFKAGEN